MTAFLFIPERDEVAARRRVDFTNIASLFGEADEMPKRSRRQFAHLFIATIILLIAMGDTLLVARPELLASLAETGQAAMHTLGSSGRV